MADDTNRINALNGGAPLPQADTMTIAKRLLGPDLANRYGDVIGARERNIGDVARDFAIGFISKDPTKADQIKAQVAANFQDQLGQQERQAAARDEANRARTSAFFGLVKQVQGTPKELRKGLLQEGLAKLGMEATPTVLKILENPDLLDAGANLTSPDMLALADSDPEKFLAQATEILGDSSKAVGFLSDLQGLQKQRVDTQNAILRGQRAARGRVIPAPADVIAKRKAAWSAKMLGRTVTDPDTGEKTTLGPADVARLADEAEAAGIFGTSGIQQTGAEPVHIVSPPSEAAPVGLPQVPSVDPFATTTPTTSTTTTGGLPQAPSVPRITGTVTKVD